MAEEWLRILFSHVTANGLPPHIAAPSDNAFGGTLRSGRRANIEEEDGLVVILVVLTRVVVDDIANLLLLAVDFS